MKSEDIAREIADILDEVEDGDCFFQAQHLGGGRIDLEVWGWDFPLINDPRLDSSYTITVTKNRASE